jgi:hypothetical protein
LRKTLSGRLAANAERNSLLLGWRIGPSYTSTSLQHGTAGAYRFVPLLKLRVEDSLMKTVDIPSA